jgi:hypothetical protein
MYFYGELVYTPKVGLFVNAQNKYLQSSFADKYPDIF